MHIKRPAWVLLQQSRAEIDDAGQCVFTPPFTQVIKSCWRSRLGCTVSLGSFPALHETGSTNTKAHMCSHLKIWSHFPWTSVLSFFFSLTHKLPLSFALFFISVFLTLSALLYLTFLPSFKPLSRTHWIFYFNPLFLHFTSFFPAPSATHLFRFLRKSHSLIWDMLDLVSLKATLLTPCLPLLRTAQAI